MMFLRHRVCSAVPLLRDGRISDCGVRSPRVVQLSVARWRSTTTFQLARCRWLSVRVVPPERQRPTGRYRPTGYLTMTRCQYNVCVITTIRVQFDCAPTIRRHSLPS